MSTERVSYFSSYENSQVGAGYLRQGLNYWPNIGMSPWAVAKTTLPVIVVLSVAASAPVTAIAVSLLLSAETNEVAGPEEPEPPEVSEIQPVEVCPQKSSLSKRMVPALALVVVPRRMAPSRSNFSTGESVPMPTLPSDNIDNAL